MVPVILFPDLHLPLLTLAGMSEELSLAGEMEDVRNVNGYPFTLTMPYSLYDIRLSLDGAGRLMPPVENLRIGTVLTYFSTADWSVILAPGQVSAVLSRLSVPGSVHARDVETGEPIEVAINGTMVTIFGRAGWTRIGYRPAFSTKVSRVDPWGSDVSGRRRSAGFQLAETP